MRCPWGKLPVLVGLRSFPRVLENAIEGFPSLANAFCFLCHRLLFLTFIAHGQSMARNPQSNKSRRNSNP